jgi:cytochrome c553
MTWPRLLALALCCNAPLAGWCADDAVARGLAATCANCHGTEGRAASRDIPGLAGMPREKVVAAMKAFRSGARPATVMHQLARGYTDAQIDRVAEYFASRKD